MSDDQGEEAATLPCILVTSCDSSFKPEELIRQIIGCESLPAATETELACFPWTISNKYYTARVRLCAAPSVACVTAEVARTVQAFIVYFDSNTQDGLSRVGPWLPVVEDLAPEVLILACDHVSDGVARQEAQHWCLDHAFELVEMNPQELPDEDDDFPESTGVKRILQALNANVWSSVEMKDEHSQGFGLMSSLVAARHNVPRPAPEAPSSAVVVEKQRAESKQETAADDPMIHTDIQELAHLTSGDADVENFERLFTKLKEMKDKASSLPHEQRKVHAEKVAKAFWMAIGGDQAEIDGLSSGEES